MQKLVHISRTQDPSGRRLRENLFSLQGGGVGCMPKLGPETSLNFRGWPGGQVITGGWGGGDTMHPPPHCTPVRDVFPWYTPTQLAHNN